MFRIDAPHLAWVLENLVEGKVVNQITVDPDTTEWAKVALAAHARHHLGQPGRDGPQPCHRHPAPSTSGPTSAADTRGTVRSRPDDRPWSDHVTANSPKTPGSSSPATAAWSAPRSSAGSRPRGYTNLLTADRDQLDLRDQAAVNYWFRANRPEYVFLVAGTVGGIMANSTRPAEFLYDNMMIHATVVHASHLFDVAQAALPRQLVHLPPRGRRSRSPRTQLLTGPLEPTNEAYALAKIAGIKLCQSYRRQYGCNFISAMPTNLYGPNDNFDLTEQPRAAGADPQVPRRQASTGRTEVEIWGTGTPAREFLHVDDLADACLFLMDNYDGRAAHQRRHRRGPQHPGAGRDGPRRSCTPAPSSSSTRPSPTARPASCSTSPASHDLGWHHRIELRDGISSVYGWFLEHGTDPDLHERAVAHAH